MTTTPETRLRQLGLELPEPPAPAGSYVPAVRTGRLVMTAGQIPLREGNLVATGVVGAEVSLEDARQAARQCVLNALAAVREEIGELRTVRRILRLNAFVASAEGFFGQSKVADAASDLLTEIFGEAGRHTRCAIGAARLPLNAPVEIDLVVELG